MKPPVIDSARLAALGSRGAQLAYAIASALDEGRFGDGVRALTDAGDALATVGDGAGTLLAYEQAEAVAAEAGLRGVLGDLYWRLGQVSEAIGRLEPAADYFDRAAARFAMDGDLGDQSVALQASGRCRVRVGGADQALQRFRDAVAAARQVGDEMLLAVAMEEMAMAASLVGRTEEAAASFSEARRLYRSAVDQAGVIRSTVGLAEAEIERGDHVKAIHTLAPIEEALEAAEDPETVGRGLGLIALFHLLSDDQEAGVEAFGRAVQHLAEGGAVARRAKLTLDFARLTHEKRGAHVAVALYEAALELFRKVGDLPRIGPAAYSLAACCTELGNLVVADEHIDEALEACQRLSDVEGLEICTSLAVKIAVGMGQGKLALRRLELAARVKGALGDYAGEVRYLYNALKASLAVPELDPASVADALLDALGRSGPQVLAHGEIEEMAESMAQAGRQLHAMQLMALLAAAEKFASRNQSAATAYAKAAVFACRGDDLEEAEQLWDQAIAIGETYHLPQTEHWRRDRDSTLP